MAFAVGSILDDEHGARVLAVREELERSLGLAPPWRASFAHFSYQVAAGYDLDKLLPFVEELAGRTPPFELRTAGLGVFTPKRVAFVRIVRRGWLSGFHARLWTGLDGIGSGVEELYNPGRWVPHVTLARVDDLERLAEVVRFLGDRTMEWRLPIDNLAVVEGGGTLHARFDLGGG